MRSLRTLAQVCFMLLIAFILGSTVRPAAAQADDSLQIHAFPGLDGRCRAGAWAPIQIEVQNTGSGLEGRLELVVDRTTDIVYQNTLDIPSGSRKSVTFYVRIKQGSPQFLVRYVSKQRIITSQALEFDCASNAQRLIGILAARPSAFNPITAVNLGDRQPDLVYLAADSIPDRSQGLDMLESLVISGIDSNSLTVTQVKAILAWVERGGHLILTGGPSGRTTLAAFEHVLPADVQNEITLTGWQALVAQTEPRPQPLSILELVPRPQSDVLLEIDDAALIVQKPNGLGKITLLAADPSFEPLLSTPAIENLYARLFPIAGGQPPWSGGVSDNNAAASAAITFADLGRPSILPICGFMIFYALLIGPINYGFLKWRDRRELAWITIPLLVFILSGVSLIIGQSLRGDRPILQKLAVIRVGPQATLAQVDVLVSIFSPNRAAYDLSVDPDFAIEPLEDQAVLPSRNWTFLRNDRNQSQVQNLRVDIGSVRAISAHGEISAPNFEHDLQVTLNDSGATLSGTLYNRSEIDFYESYLLSPAGIRPLNDLRSGGQSTIPDTPLPQSMGASPNSNANLAYQLVELSGGYSMDPDYRLRTNLISALIPWTGSRQKPLEGYYFVGWSQGAPLEASLAGIQAKASELSLYLLELQPDWRLSSDSIQLNAPLYQWQVVNTDAVLRGEAGPYLVNINRGSFELLLTPLPDLDIATVDRFDLNLAGRNVAGSTLPLIELYNWQTQAWEIIAINQWGSYAVPEAGRFVDREGAIRLRVEVVDSASHFEIDALEVALQVRLAR